MEGGGGFTQVRGTRRLLHLPRGSRRSPQPRDRLMSHRWILGLVAFYPRSREPWHPRHRGFTCWIQKVGGCMLRGSLAQFLGKQFRFNNTLHQLQAMMRNFWKSGGLPTGARCCRGFPTYISGARKVATKIWSTCGLPRAPLVQADLWSKDPKWSPDMSGAQEYN